MLVEALQQDVALLWPSAQSLTLDERMHLQLALLKIYEYEDFAEVFFWGRVRGIQKDYFLARAVNYTGHYEFPVKKFFWCAGTSWVFAELPAAPEVDPAVLESFNSVFSGEHDKILVQAPEDEDAPEDEGGTHSIEMPAKDLTELDRLAAVVRTIENDCAVVPCGAYRMTPAHELVRNKGFNGLPRAQLKNLEKYLHFRKVQLQDKQEQLEREQVLFSHDFLDPIDRDSPSGCWSVWTNEAGDLANVRSLLWPGYCAYHRADTQRFGGVYFGDGVRNSDLPFMLS